MKAEYLELNQYPHNQVISEANIIVSDLEDDIRILMQDFNKRYKGFMLKRTEEGAQILMSQSNLLAQRIYDYYVDKDDQSVLIEEGGEISKKEIKEIASEIKEEIKEEQTLVQNNTETPASKELVPPAVSIASAVSNAIENMEEKEPSDKNEKALFLLFKAGKTEGITTKDLKDNNFDTGVWGPLSARGCRLGAYKLSKSPSEITFKLEKI